MIDPKITRGARLGLLACATLLIAACEDRTRDFLPGEREDIRAVLQRSDGEVDGDTDQALPISVGTATRNANWSQFWGTPANRTAHPALSATPQLAWSAKIGTGNGRRQRVTAEPVIGDGRIYTLDAGARVSAVSPSGVILWSVDLTPVGDGADEATGGGLAYADGKLFVALGFGSLSALDAASGATVWTQDLEATGAGAPAVSGDLVYVTSGDDTGWAIDADDGRVQWQLSTTENVSNVLGAPSPVVAGELAIFAFGSGDVQAVFKRGGLRRWDATVVGERAGFALSKISDITAAPVVDGDKLYVGNQSGRTVALSASGGERIWTAVEGAQGPVWPAGDSVFLVSDRNELVRLSDGDGSRIWGTALPNFTKDRPLKRAAVFAHFGPVLAGGNLMLASSDGRLRSFDPVDGTLVTSTDIPGGAATSPAFADGTLYIVNTRGELLAYR